MKRKNASIRSDWIPMAVAVCTIVPIAAMHAAFWISAGFGMQKIQEWQISRKSAENWKKCHREPF